MTDEQHKNIQVSKQELRTSVTLKDNLMHRFMQWLEDNDLAPHQGLKICIISQLSNYANSLRATTSSRAHVSSNSVICKQITRKPQERKKYSQEFIAEIERREDTNFIATAIKNQWKEILDTGFTSSELAGRYNRHCKLHGKFAKKAYNWINAHSWKDIESPEAKKREPELKEITEEMLKEKQPLL